MKASGIRRKGWHRIVTGFTHLYRVGRHVGMDTSCTVLLRTQDTTHESHNNNTMTVVRCLHSSEDDTHNSAPSQALNSVGLISVTLRPWITLIAAGLCSPLVNNWFSHFTSMARLPIQKSISQLLHLLSSWVLPILRSPVWEGSRSNLKLFRLP